MVTEVGGGAAAWKAMASRSQQSRLKATWKHPPFQQRTSKQSEHQRRLDLSVTTWPSSGGWARRRDQNRAPQQPVASGTGPQRRKCPASLTFHTAQPFTMSRAWPNAPPNWRIEYTEKPREPTVVMAMTVWFHGRPEKESLVGPIDEHFAKLGTLREDILKRLNMSEAHEAATADVFPTTNAIRTRVDECLQWARKEIESFKADKVAEARNAKLNVDETRKQLADHDAQLFAVTSERAAIEAVYGDKPAVEHQRSLENLANAEGVVRTSIEALRRQLELFESMHSSALKAHEEAPPSHIPGLVERNSWLQDIQQQADALWKELETRKRLNAALKADFESKSQIFVKAEGFHRKEANRLMYIMGSLVVLGGVAILLAFGFVGEVLKASGDSEWERIAIVFGGRIALLLLIAWTIRFVGNLHRAHSEQAVIYQDRQAALGIVQSMVNTSADVEYRREVLGLLAEGYLNFELSAFRVGASTLVKEGDAIDREIKHVKKAVDAIKPIFDAVTKVAEKAVEKTK